MLTVYFNFCKYFFKTRTFSLILIKYLEASTKTVDDIVFSLEFFLVIRPLKFAFYLDVKNIDVFGIGAK
jgi:hypothetical protein